MIYQIDVEAVAPVYPTEDADRVRQAILALFPNADVEEGHGELIGRAHSVDRLGEMLADQRILETARGELLGGIEGDTVSFSVKKQAASAGVVNFALDEPAELGDIAVSIRVERPTPRRFVEDLTAPGDGG